MDADISVPYFSDATFPDFQKALKFDLDFEGRIYENVPGDPGGPTKWGITWEDYAAWRTAKGKTPLQRPSDVAYATESEITQIYWERYWVPMKGTQFPDPLDQTLFDAAVNCGCSRSVKWLQAALGVTEDGQIGPQTLAAANRYLSLHGQGLLCDGLLARRRAYYLSRGSWADKFKAGWINRINALAVTVKASLKKGGSK